MGSHDNVADLSCRPVGCPEVCSSSGDLKRGSGFPQGLTGRGVEESVLIFVS